MKAPTIYAPNEINLESFLKICQSDKMDSINVVLGRDVSEHAWIQNGYIAINYFISYYGLKERSQKKMLTPVKIGEIVYKKGDYGYVDPVNNQVTGNSPMKDLMQLWRNNCIHIAQNYDFNLVNLLFRGSKIEKADVMDFVFSSEAKNEDPVEFQLYLNYEPDYGF